ncbi:hypothetical protein YPPY66_2259 [Yersinia pestis PY-66]|uniref:Uncharacterized protein n=1 Tax=Yersinia pestis PY-08 TaxID=992134 RepID=A0AB72ZKU3_YERPE|nr:hypothetical protein YPPY01_1973 [Yersinia pestis PY-01]EIQ90943.1 hypothetical protein YPPY02_2007 [Yersinia pestis PY-02]EIR07362.1 hypothetical protein YPPY06_2079 [Yersinia pestis PY-06]EIR18734.1 hypothetical protein YPPY07_1945 [Yersinia pestis PY-07]EIR19708.1 hypothetical protein YPPY08_2055 [Yersinia pestis PY-08]EIR21390.1 hypothetical protein YPPY09_2077 [Yersinia pestis PY-09]EIR34654.1 hypothetical protein YPPY11_2149 [Yersinia pestis PY-11]EIR47594.1 hypothetical protein YPP
MRIVKKSTQAVTRAYAAHWLSVAASSSRVRLIDNRSWR